MQMHACAHAPMDSDAFIMMAAAACIAAAEPASLALATNARLAPA